MIVLNRPRPPVGATFINRRSRQAIGLVFLTPPTTNMGMTDNPTTHLNMYGQNGIITGGFSWVIDKDFGPVLNHDGSNDGIWFGSVGGYGNGYSQIDGKTAITLSAWINPGTLVGNQAFFGKFWAGAGATFIFGCSSSTNIVWRLWTSAGETEKNTTVPTMVAGQWYHIAVTYNGAQMSTYFNGREASAPTAKAGTISDAGGLGVPLDLFNINSFGWPFTGKIHDPRVYARALGPGEIAELYDPRTRWELYSPSGLYVPQLAGGGVVTRSYGYIF